MLCSGLELNDITSFVWNEARNEHKLLLPFLVSCRIAFTLDFSLTGSATTFSFKFSLDTLAGWIIFTSGFKLFWTPFFSGVFSEELKNLADNITDW